MNARQRVLPQLRRKACAPIARVASAPERPGGYMISSLSQQHPKSLLAPDMKGNGSDLLPRALRQACD